MTTTSIAQNDVSDQLPKVFLIGEYEQAQAALNIECNSILLSVCKDSMELAYEKWMTMLSDMETYSEEIGFDIRGIKIWVNVYWRPDGTIRHIAYYPKPNSKNMDFRELTAFFSSFINRYQLPVEHDACFSHHGSASFPTFAKLALPKEK